MFESPQRFLVQFTHKGKKNSTTTKAFNRHLASNYILSLFGEDTVIISASELKYKTQPDDSCVDFLFPC
jgi:hypothetical protein